MEVDGVERGVDGVEASAISTSAGVVIGASMGDSGLEAGAATAAVANVEACISADASHGTASAAGVIDDEGAEEDDFLVPEEVEHLVDGHLGHVWESCLTTLH